MNEPHKSRESFLASQEDSEEELYFIEETFDLMAILIEVSTHRGHGRAAGIGFDLYGCPEIISYAGT
ncbi:hypothetical protein IFJ82_09245 [Novacetimonas hansenii]|uniref:hypothetical protein n=1 Tax=Novacetimonas hansenii TaxID=436 RepID=UPI00177F80C8|nr:hypothetical protein IFJ82_09245 [Novacetimonas hansenii]